MKREGCADFHVEQSAGDSCTMCHQYHIGEFATEGIPPTRIDDLDKTKPATSGNRNQQDAAVSGEVPEVRNTDDVRTDDEEPQETPPDQPVVTLELDSAGGSDFEEQSDDLPDLFNELLKGSELATQPSGAADAGQSQ